MKHLFIAVLLALASACASTVQKPEFVNSNARQFDSWQTHQLQVETYKDHWQLSGRFGASTEDDAWSGSIFWQQRSHEFAIQLAGPLNQGAIILRGDKSNAELHLGGKSTYHDGNAESLLSRYTGWTIPFEGLRYWVLGLPQPIGARQKITLDNEGRISHIQHPEWDIQFKQYRRRGDISVPRKIVLSNSEIRIRLVLDRWEFNG